jgi:hypothetical protein
MCIIPAAIYKVSLQSSFGYEEMCCELLHCNKDKQNLKKKIILPRSLALVMYFRSKIVLNVT